MTSLHRYPRAILVIVMVLNLFVSCNDRNIYEVDLLNTDGDRVSFGTVAEGKHLVFVFMSPDCPLCINYTRTLRLLSDTFSEAGVIFFTVFPGKFHRQDEVDSFVEKYDFRIPVVLDPDLKLATLAGATVTPEAFLADPGGHIIYRGAVDDWMYETGKKRPFPTAHYLRDAISNALAGKSPHPAETQAFGCMIEGL